MPRLPSSSPHWDTDAYELEYDEVDDRYTVTAAGGEMWQLTNRDTLAETHPDMLRIRFSREAQGRYIDYESWPDWFLPHEDAGYSLTINTDNIVTVRMGWDDGVVTRVQTRPDYLRSATPEQVMQTLRHHREMSRDRDIEAAALERIGDAQFIDEAAEISAAAYPYTMRQRPKAKPRTQKRCLRCGNLVLLEHSLCGDCADSGFVRVDMLMEPRDEDGEPRPLDWVSYRDSPPAAGVLMQHDWVPRMRKKFLPHEDTTITPTLGLELELRDASLDDMLAGRQYRAKPLLHPYAAADMLTNAFMYCKRDGTVPSGFEAVTHPFSYGWYMRNREMFDRLLSLPKYGYRSHQTESCGMHVHISKDSFTELHIFKFMKFVYEEIGFVLKASQRRVSLIQRWASLDTGHGGNDPNEIMYRAKTKGNGSLNKYVAVNLSHRNTVELRIFRGNLERTAFFKNIELTYALFEFTKQASVQGISESEFVTYLKDNKARYPYALDWLSRRQLVNI